MKPFVVITIAIAAFFGAACSSSNSTTPSSTAARGEDTETGVATSTTDGAPTSTTEGPSTTQSPEVTSTTTGGTGATLGPSDAAAFNDCVFEQLSPEQLQGLEDPTNLSIEGMQNLLIQMGDCFVEFAGLTAEEGACFAAGWPEMVLAFESVDEIESISDDEAAARMQAALEPHCDPATAASIVDKLENFN